MKFNLNANKICKIIIKTKTLLIFSFIYKNKKKENDIHTYIIRSQTYKYIYVCKEYVFF